MSDFSSMAYLIRYGKIRLRSAAAITDQSETLGGPVIEVQIMGVAQSIIALRRKY